MSPEHLSQIHAIFHSLKRGDRLTQSETDALETQWEPLISPSQKERFALCLSNGEPTGTLAPRWLCHLVGLRHRAVEIALLTESGLIALQRRSITKSDGAGALDMSVAGHVVEYDAFLTSAWKEIEEEIGLSEARKSEWLIEKDLIPLGEPYLCLHPEPTRVPPQYNSEVRQIYVGTLTGTALGAMRFADGEAEGMMFVTPEVAWRLLTEEEIASGMRYTLPRVLDWLEKTKTP
ncbi:MAG: NUDIX domain-containing protein [Chthonomonadaceae bacterium]|nr:NUDIX domain-containing protein [Chthonomonadaceae bacterium]